MGVVSDALSSATILPSNMTRMRSDSAKISSSSVETMRIALPSSRLRTICSWMYSIEPTSMPRVGWAHTTSGTSRLNSRATIIFWALPPDSASPELSMIGGRTS